MCFSTILYVSFMWAQTFEALIFLILLMVAPFYFFAQPIPDLEPFLKKAEAIDMWEICYLKGNISCLKEFPINVTVFKDGEVILKKGHCYEGIEINRKHFRAIICFSQP